MTAPVPRAYRPRPAVQILLVALLNLLGSAYALAAPISLCSSVSPAPPGACVIGGSVAVAQMQAACGKPATKSPAVASPSCTPVPRSAKAKVAYWQTLTVASQTISETARLEGWSLANDPSQGVVPGVCYNDQAGNGTVGYGHEYPGGHSCAYLAENSIPSYEHYLAHPLHPNGPRARALLQNDIVTKAVTPINQYATKELTAQQLNALIPWVFNIGKAGLHASDALANINAC